MDQQIIEHEGEVEQLPSLDVLGGGLAAQMATAEITQQIATARQYPRDITKVAKNIHSLVTLDKETADECIYALPRGGKPIEGPSIRLAEIIQQCWGNNRVAARVVEIDRTEKVVVAEAVFHDLETNAAVRTSVRRRITDRQGRILSDDMIVVTGNAAISIAKRNAILASVPKAVWNRAYRKAEEVLKGDIKTLAERRSKAIASFARWGVKPEQIFAALGLSEEHDITIDHMPTIQGMFNAIRNGEETVESLFSGRATAAGKQFDKVADPLKDDELPAAGAAGAAGATKLAAQAPNEQAGPQAGGPAGAEVQGAPAGSESGALEGATNGQGSPQAAAGLNDALKSAFAHGEAQAKRDAARKLPKALQAEDRPESEREAWFLGYDQARAGMKKGEAA